MSIGDQLTNEETQPTAEHENLEDLYELSPMQQGMFFHSLYAPASGVYFEQSIFTIEGELDHAAFQRAWQQLVDRHPILRTAILYQGVEKPLQVVYRHIDFDIARHDWRSLTADEQREQLEVFIRDDQARGFDFTRAPLMRAALIQTSDDNFKFIWSRHHVILDRWSRGLVLKEVFSSYYALCNGRQPSVKPTRPYSHYIGWLLAQDRAAAEAFWRRSLSGLQSPTRLDFGSHSSLQARERENYEQQGIRLSAEATYSLRQFAREQKLTMNTLVQGAWALLLSRYSGEQDVLFGATVSGRPPDLAGVEEMVGLFINTLPVRVQVTPQTRLSTWLENLQYQQSEQRQYEHSSLIDIHGWSEIPRGVPLFESILIFENLPVDSSFREQEGNVAIRGDRGVGSKTSYPLTIMVNPGAELSVHAVYDSDRFDPAAIERLLGHFRVVLQGFTGAASKPLSEISLLDHAEKDELLATWNKTSREYDRQACIHRLIEKQAAIAPENVAVVFEQQELSYGELNRRANQLAHYLKSRGVGPEVLVGICVERSLEMVVTLLGVLKAGAAYVPLDAAFPDERLAFMVHDAGLPLILTKEHLRKRLPADATVVCVDQVAADLTSESETNLIDEVASQNLAYVIYTSGSTGQPKGVQVEHAAVVNFLTAMTVEPGLNETDRLLAVTTLSFDIAGLEIYLPLIVGARLVLASRNEAADGRKLLQKIANCGITTLQSTPATWRLLLEAGWSVPERGLKMLCGGEALSRDLADALVARGSSVWNMYGPTETTIWSAVARIDRGEGPVRIGGPIANTELYVLDEALNPAPIGVVGELCIGGEGVARGYLGRADLTAEKFVPDSFSARVGARLYRTGDLVRRLTDGSLEFLGRVDFQVKVRGFRIELGEIEAALRGHDQVSDAVVVVREDDGDRRLVAYVVYKAHGSASTNQLRTFLQQTLPDYMIPSVFVTMKALPLTTSGKVDRRYLPAPDESRPDLDESLVAPRTPVEEEVAKIWEQVLKVKGVGVLDNFFALGGHSLLATQAISRVNELFAVELPLRVIFEQPTVAAMAHAVTEYRSTAGEDETARLLAELALLSDEEAQRLLNPDVVGEEN